MTGGDVLQKYLEKVADRLARAGTGASVSVGFLAGSVNRSGESIPVYMAANEFGTSRIPPRPFFRNMIAAKGPAWGGNVAELLKNTEYDSALTLIRMGHLISGQLQVSINETNTPPNAPSTIARKGASKPLIDTSDAWKSVNFVVTGP